MSPEVGRSKPAIRRSVVVLPQPDGPSREKNSPDAIWRSIASTATTSSKRFSSASSRTSPPSWPPTTGLACAAAAISISPSLLFHPRQVHAHLIGRVGLAAAVPEPAQHQVGAADPD